MVISCAAYNCSQRSSKNSVISFHRFPVDPELRKKWIMATKRVKFNPTKNSYICSNHFTEADFCILVGKKRLYKNAVPSKFNFRTHLTKEIADGCTKWSKCIKFNQNDDIENIEHVPSASVINGDNMDNNITLQSEDIKNMEHIPSTSILNGHNTDNNVTLESADIKNIEHIPCTTTVYGNNTDNNITVQRKRSGASLYFGDFVESDLECPKKAKIMWQKSKNLIAAKNKKLKVLRIANKRFKKKINTFETLVEHLRKTYNISDSCLLLLKKMDPYASVSKGKLKLKGDDGIKKKKKNKNKKILEQVSRTMEVEEKQQQKSESKRTQAEIAFQKMQEKMQTERILEKASMTHKERVEKFNQHLDGLTEHFDIPKVSWTK